MDKLTRQTEAAILRLVGKAIAEHHEKSPLLGFFLQNEAARREGEAKVAAKVLYCPEDNERCFEANCLKRGSCSWDSEGLDSAATPPTADKCEHMTTKRGGVIWTICEDCGAKWADDDPVTKAKREGEQRGYAPHAMQPDGWTPAKGKYVKPATPPAADAPDELVQRLDEYLLRLTKDKDRYSAEQLVAASKARIEADAKQIADYCEQINVIDDQLDDHKESCGILQKRVAELEAGMVDVHVKDSGVWLSFKSKTGRVASINIYNKLDALGTGLPNGQGIINSALNLWHNEQMERLKGAANG